MIKRRKELGPDRKPGHAPDRPRLLTKSSQDTALRDMTHLVDEGILVRSQSQNFAFSRTPRSTVCAPSIALPAGYEPRNMRRILALFSARAGRDER